MKSKELVIRFEKSDYNIDKAIIHADQRIEFFYKK